MSMKAFYKDEKVLKVYDQKEDWQVLFEGKEYWYSVWQADKKASLMRAVKDTLSRSGLQFSESKLVVIPQGE